MLKYVLDFGKIEDCAFKKILQNIINSILDYFEKHNQFFIQAKIEKINCNSNYIININFKNFQKSLKLIVKIFFSPKSYYDELHILNILNNVQTSHFVRFILTDIMKKYRAIAYYNVNQTPFNRFLTIKDYILSHKDSSRLEGIDAINKSVLFNYFILNKTDNFISLKKDYDDFFENLILKIPSNYILDLSNIEYEYNNERIFIERNEINKLEKDSLITFDFVNKSFIKLRCLNWMYKNKVVMSFGYNKEKICIILDNNKYLNLNSGEITLDVKNLNNKKILYKTEAYIQHITGIKIKNALSEIYITAINTLYTYKPDLILCHNDFHNENIFITKDDFRIIDLSGISTGFKYTDLCRLQLSIIKSLLNSFNDISKFITEFIDGINGISVNNYWINFLCELKKKYDYMLDVTTNNNEYFATLLLEISLQGFYCICSSTVIPVNWGRFIDKIISVINNQIKISDINSNI